MTSANFSTHTPLSRGPCHIFFEYFLEQSGHYCSGLVKITVEKCYRYSSLRCKQTSQNTDTGIQTAYDCLYAFWPGHHRLTEWLGLEAALMTTQLHSVPWQGCHPLGQGAIQPGPKHLQGITYSNWPRALPRYSWVSAVPLISPRTHKNSHLPNYFTERWLLI